MFWRLLTKEGKVHPVTPSLSSRRHLLSRLPALPVVVVVGGRVYAWDWGVGDNMLYPSIAD